MAGNFQFALGWQTYTPTASAAAAGHPASNMALVKQPRLTWKDSGTGTGASIICDQGAAVTLGAAFLNGGTVASWTVEESATGSSGWSALAASPIAIPTDERVGDRRKGWLTLSSTLRYVRFTVASLAAGETVAELGALALIPAASIVTLTRNFGRPVPQPRMHQEVLDFPGGGFDVNEDGDDTMDYDLGHPTLVVAGGTPGQLFTIKNTRDVIVYENFDNPAHAYLGRIIGMDAMPRAAFVTSTSLQFREYA